jgi:hypothetical protein
LKKGIKIDYNKSNVEGWNWNWNKSI